MELMVHGLNIRPTEAMAQYVERRIAVALSRLSHVVHRIVLRVQDINGPRGGVNKRCHALIELRAGGHVVVEDVDEDVYRAVDKVAMKAKRTVRRALNRRRDRRRRGWWNRP